MHSTILGEHVFHEHAQRCEATCSSSENPLHHLAASFSSCTSLETGFLHVTSVVSLSDYAETKYLLTKVAI